MGLLNLIHIIDPGRIVLGGPLSVIYPLVEDRVLERLSSGLMYGLKIPPISVDKFGGDDAAVGAAAAVREKLFALPELRSY
jgi:predicted NBD/HSP70 family sugar kinase